MAVERTGQAPVAFSKAKSGAFAVDDRVLPGAAVKADPADCFFLRKAILQKQ